MELMRSDEGFWGGSDGWGEDFLKKGGKHRFKIIKEHKHRFKYVELQSNHEGKYQESI